MNQNKNYQLIDIAGHETRIAGYFDTMTELKRFADGYRAGKKNCKLIIQKWNPQKGKYALLSALIK
ncbi:MAG: hypothetical protein IJ642_06385 [Oscillospiraceae bacterium]|nr:hypothetical protein [Oscillospiraceae bacterium]